MIQRPRFRNPYDFVPLEGEPSLDPPVGDGALKRSGVLVYRLEALTPIAIHQSPGEPDPATRLHRFAHFAGRPILPATSLKGMLRSVHETLTNSTMGLLGTRRGWYRRQVPDGYRPGEGRRLSASERVFGMVGGDRQGSVGYAGRLLIDDLPLPDGSLIVQPVSRPAGGQPKPEHESFYFRPDRKVLGRKFYYHQQSYAAVRAIYAEDRRMPEIKVQAIRPGQQLIGELRFVGLHEDDLADLIYTLVLEPGLAHKLGYGKPLGLGSLRISVLGLAVEPLDERGRPQRFFTYYAPAADPAEPARAAVENAETWRAWTTARGMDDRTAEVPALAGAALARWIGRGDAGAASHAAFAAIARWQPDANTVYPDFPFFRGERNRNVKTTLWEYQGRAANQLYPGGAELPAAAPAPPEQRRETRVELPPERQSGLFERDETIGYCVRIAEDKRYPCRPTDGASRKLLRRLADQLSASGPVRVSFMLELQPNVNNKLEPVAVSLELDQEGP
jgi:hypothetical protein